VTLPAVFRRLLYLLRQRKNDADLAEELAFHHAMKRAELERSGLPEEDAEFASRRALGNTTLAREEARAVWVWRWLDDLWRDFACSTRRIRASPGFSGTAILTLAIVIGANSAMFSAVHAVLLRPFTMQHPDDLVICWSSDPRRNLPIVELSYRNFEDWATHSRSFAQVAAVGSSTWPAVVDESGGSTRLSTAGVSVSFFQTMGVLPVLGRDFRPQDDEPKVGRVAILSHGMWVSRFGADPGAIGRTLRFGDGPHTIVGVLPEGFDFPRGTDLWTPVVPILADSANEWRTDGLESVGVLFVIGRLHPAVTPTMALQELDRLAGSLEQRTSFPRFGSRVVVTPLLDYVLGPVRQGLWALLAAVGVLLLVGCANLSGLMLTRVSSRRREHAVLVALGATRGALARRWMMETLILSLTGGIIGLLAAYSMARTIVALAPDIPRLAGLAINPPVVAFTFGVILLTTLLCAVAPIRSVNANSLIAAINESARSTHSRQTYHTQSLLVTGQVALSVILLVAAGLITRSFVNLRSIDLGFLSPNVMTMTIEPRNVSGATNAWMDQLLNRLTALPGVEAAGAVYLRPLALGPIGQETPVVLEGQQITLEAQQENPQLNYQVATPGYFSAMRIQLRQGRLFTAEDTDRSPRVAVVSETTARRLWPGENPIGKRMSMPLFTPDKPSYEWRTVVGVVNDVRYRGMDDVRLDVYDVAAQSPTEATDVVIRTSGDPLINLEAITQEARHLDPGVVVDRVTTMDTIVSQAVAPWRFSVWMFSMFAIVAFVLVTLGLFSTVTLDIAQRHKEFAVRLALGGQYGDIVRPLVLKALKRGAAGIALGVLAALTATRGLSSMLVGVDTLDVVTYGAVIGLVFATVMIASWLPAHSATKADLMLALRVDS
jgi:putative ABC transport system permease protein